MQTITIQVDDADADAIRAAIARRQAMRIGGKPILPDGDGDLAGRYLAEVCRGWLERTEQDE